jgi:hypothetical protein
VTRQQDPFIVRIMDPPSELEELAEILVSAVGLSGALTLAAALLGAILGALIFWKRSRSA